MARPSFQAITQSVLATAFIVAGMLGFWSVSNFQTSTADTAGTVQLVPAKSSVAFGEAVSFTLTNGTASELALRSAAPFRVKREGVVIFAPIAAQALTPVAPGGAVAWSWDQTDTDGQPVKAGAYTISLSYTVGQVDDTAETTVTVGSASSSPSPASTSPTPQSVPASAPTTLNQSGLGLPATLGIAAILSLIVSSAILYHSMRQLNTDSVV